MNALHEQPIVEITPDPDIPGGVVLRVLDQGWSVADSLSAYLLHSRLTNPKQVVTPEFDERAWRHEEVTGCCMSASLLFRAVLAMGDTGRHRW